MTWATYIFSFAILLVTAPSDTAATPRAVAVSAEYAFGPELSQAEACRRAEDRAKEAAIRTVHGESLFSESVIDCRERGGEDCSYMRTTISHLNGFLLSFEEKRVQAWDQGPVRVCRVSGRATVDARSASGRLFFKASLNRSVFRVGDEVVIALEVPVRSFIAAFSREDSTLASFKRIYPNRIDQGSAIEGKFSLPAPGSGYKLVASMGRPTANGASGNTDRDLTLRISPAEGGNAKIEHLYLIATEERVHWLEAYSVEELQNHLARISPEKRFVRPLTYRILH